MNKISRLDVFMILLITIMPNASFANESSNSMVKTNLNNDQLQVYSNDPYNQERQNQNYNSNPNIIGDSTWETTSSRMNRQAATSNTRFNPNQNSNEQTEDNSWETTSSRMNRQANVHHRSNSTWIRNEQDRHDSNTATRRNI